MHCSVNRIPLDAVSSSFHPNENPDPSDPPKRCVCAAPQIYFLNREHQQFMHPSANRIPVLVLDYDTDLDLVNDAGARKTYADQVRPAGRVVMKLLSST